MNKEKIKQFESQCWEDDGLPSQWFAYMKFAELVWNEAYRKGLDDGWTDAMGKDSGCPCGADGGTSCGDPNCLMITGEKE